MIFQKIMVLYRFCFLIFYHFLWTIVSKIWERFNVFTFVLPGYKKHVCSKCALHNNEWLVGPDHFALVSFTLVVQIRLYFGSDGNRCRCNLQRHTSMALSKIISLKPDRKLVLCESTKCTSQLYVNEGVWACRNTPLNFKCNIFMV